MRVALQRVKSNKGAPGIDKMTVKQLPVYLKRHWIKIRQAILDGAYDPLPVRRKEIPKPDGGVRLLGIPTVLDRLVQQAVAQVLQKIWDHTFSESSFGFRPGRSQHDAIKRAHEYVKAEYRTVVDMDLSKFFDRVNHDRLMSGLATRIKDKRVLKLIRKFLTAGIMTDGLVSSSEEGTPRGGPLSPLLSNIVLDELDKELERRNLKFVRYADDFMVYLKSRRAGERVMNSVSKFITNKLRLKVNEEKSAISHPWWRCYLGFSFTSSRANPQIRIHSKSIKKFKERIKELTPKNSGGSINRVIRELNSFTRGWWNYYRQATTRSMFRSLNGWMFRRLRAMLWKQWKNPRTRVRNLKKLGISHSHAMTCVNSRKGCWRMSRVKWLIIALPNNYFIQKHGLFLP
ncbi:MAG: group II intron reverse transcriptase/maturase, partial [Kiritimatiellaeota bacterium]|nr:group II intron reverse transcriptase/maturase [Kiritimatiellota bacterium]